MIVEVESALKQKLDPVPNGQGIKALLFHSVIVSGLATMLVPLLHAVSFLEHTNPQ